MKAFVIMLQSYFAFVPAQPVCPCSFWTDDLGVSPAPFTNAELLNLGVKFTSDIEGYISAIRYYKLASANCVGTHIGRLYDMDGTVLGVGLLAIETDSGWQVITLEAPVQINPGITYLAAATTPESGCYAASVAGGGFDLATTDPLHIVGPFFATGSGIPDTEIPERPNYWIDVIFETSLSTLAPTPVRTCPCSLFDVSLPHSNPPFFLDNSAVTLGVKFSSEIDGYIYGIRFYKDGSSTGQHIGMLYALDGSNLEQVTFVDETNEGWQTALFDVPIAVSANTIYIAAYLAPSGYSATIDDFVISVNSPPLHTLLPSGSPSGVYGYGSGPVYPTTAVRTNYWVDVVFDIQVPPPTPTRSPSTHAPTHVAVFPPLIDPNVGPGGPLLIVTSPTDQFSFYYAEILRTEGLNYFTTLPLSAISSVASLASYRIVILPSMVLDATQISIFTTWVNGGGNIIGMSPEAAFFDLFGIQGETGSVLDGYILVDSTTAPGKGIASTTMQFHGLAKQYTLQPTTTSLAQLYSSASQATGFPALVLAPHGSGFAAAFAFDLARSIVYTRQGNPTWIGQERDGVAPIRPDDLFFGGNEPDWIDLTKVAIPQADEQQRLLVNLMLHMHSSVSGPLARFWYLPDARKAVIVMTGDDHAGGGSTARFNQFVQQSHLDCNVDKWECIRGTTYMFPESPMTNIQAANFEAQGFEIGLHVDTGCLDYTPEALEAFYVDQTNRFHTNYPSISALVTERHHCIAWADYTVVPEVELSHGIRLDTNYYYWPPDWIRNTPGLFTGSALPMRFARLNGSMIDVYQLVTQMTDESGQDYPFTSDTLLSRALGEDGYYGAFTVNAHTDNPSSAVADGVLQSAITHDVAVISAKQMLGWLDARGASNFSNFAWTGGNTYSFEIHPHSSARGLQAMIPTQVATIFLLSVVRNGTTAVSFNSQTIKGVNYAFFLALEGTYVCAYSTDTTPPTIVQIVPAANANHVSVSVKPLITFSEPLDASTVSESTVELLQGTHLVPATISYVESTSAILITPEVTLDSGTVYEVVLVGPIRDLSGNVFADTPTFSFTTLTLAQCPCNALGLDIPSRLFEDPDQQVQLTLGVKFQTDVDGFIAKVRFYKAPEATGTHVALLWSSDGILLAQQSSIDETPSGWQEVTFAMPVAISANTVYVAGYFLPRSAYPAPPFAGTPISKPPITLLQPVFLYASTPSFPTQSGEFNYFVDVEFLRENPSLAESLIPPPQGTDIPLNTKVIVVFVSSINSTTITASAFSLVKTSDNSTVAGTFVYDSNTFTATFTPATLLSSLSSYIATFTGISNDPSGQTQTLTWSFTTTAISVCFAGVALNAIAEENCKIGNVQSEWDISGAGDLSIQGFATSISATIGTTIDFKVQTSSSYRFDIYRLGYYGGRGARFITSLTSIPRSQPTCNFVTATHTTDCSNWAVSGSWEIPFTAVSGIYIAKLVRTSTNGASHILFVVRNDTSASKMVVQTSDTTWQAYNSYGGFSLYTSPRAYKVSYNRPITVRGDVPEDSFFNAEYPMLRFLERNGFDLTYISGVDTARFPSLLLNQRVFLSVGHDEYWSKEQRTAVEVAGASGVNLAFFSGNEIFWKIRWENNFRTLVCYKETHDDAKIDPTAEWTGTWRDPRFSPPADGGRPENALTGTIFLVNSGTVGIEVSQEDGRMRFWRNTSIASQAVGGKTTLPVGTLGYEWDTDPDNGFRPAGNFRLSSTSATNVETLVDFGSTYASGNAFHALTMHRLQSSALVFGAGTVQWSWGLDSVHDRDATPVDTRMQQATVNLFADMGSQPATLQPSLVLATPSSDTVAPKSLIATAATALSPGSSFTVRGTASDEGGLVGGVEIFANGAWHPATGRANWSYTFVFNTTQTVMTRAVDDSGNLETPGIGVLISVLIPGLTQSPTRVPTRVPTSRPTFHPTAQPASSPNPATQFPSPPSRPTPSKKPTKSPTVQPTKRPTKVPTGRPSRLPTIQPSKKPTKLPTVHPTKRPTPPTKMQPSKVPVTSRPSKIPTSAPSKRPTRDPTGRPSKKPTQIPTSRPSKIPTSRPSKVPTKTPTRRPSKTPTNFPTKRPTKQPTSRPTKVPTSRRSG